jgi:hypothetical protein
MHRTLLTLFAALALLACGGTSRPTETAHRADDEEDEDRFVDEEVEEEEDDDEGDDGGFIDSALLRGTSQALALAEPAAVPGTGVTVRPPEGSQRMPFGAGFIAPRARIQMSVVVAEGDESVLESIRTGGTQQAPPPDHEEEVTVSGQTGRLGRDRVRTPAGILERTWLLVHDGTRGLGVVATYEADRAEAYRPVLRESLGGVEWDRDATLDASAALGVEVGPVEGLEPSHRSTANLVLIEPDAPFPPEAGQAVVTVAPLPMQVPPDQVRRACSTIAARLVPAPAADVTHEGDVEDGELPGCERLATAETQDGQRVVTYAALLFQNGMPVLLTGSVGAEHLETWRERFASAARSVRLRPPQD